MQHFVRFDVRVESCLRHCRSAGAPTEIAASAHAVVKVWWKVSEAKELVAAVAVARSIRR